MIEMMIYAFLCQFYPVNEPMKNYYIALLSNSSKLESSDKFPTNSSAM